MKKDISEMTKSELIAHIDNQIKLIKEQELESKIVMMNRARAERNLITKEK